MSKIKAIVFDWGGVLAINVFNDLLVFYARYFKVGVEKLRPVYEKHYHDFLVNNLNEKNFWRCVTRDLGLAEPLAPSLMRAAFKDIYRPQEEVIGIVVKLKDRGYLTGLLSDAEAPAAKFFFEQDYILFDAVVFSSMVNHEKPEREVYDLLLKELGTGPAETVFFDDMEENVAAARACGMYAYRVNGAKEIKAALGSHKIKL